MIIREATVADVPAIHEHVSVNAELDRMLFLSHAEIYENLRRFKVAEIAGRVVGCCALQIIWADLAEIKSLAVDGQFRGQGIARGLVESQVATAGQLGVPRVFALTLEPVFFEKLGFKRVEKSALPMKVWSDCARCPKQDHCDEIALVRDIEIPVSTAQN